MEVKEVFKLEDPITGRKLSIHLSESELLDVLQAGFFFLLQQGYINFKQLSANAQEETADAVKEAETATVQ